MGFLYGFNVWSRVERPDREIWVGLDVGTFAIRPEMAEKKKRDFPVGTQNREDLRVRSSLETPPALYTRADP